MLANRAVRFIDESVVGDGKDWNAIRFVVSVPALFVGLPALVSGGVENGHLLVDWWTGMSGVAWIIWTCFVMYRYLKAQNG